MNAFIFRIQKSLLIEMLQLNKTQKEKISSDNEIYEAGVRDVYSVLFKNLHFPFFLNDNHKPLSVAEHNSATIKIVENIAKEIFIIFTCNLSSIDKFK